MEQCIAHFLDIISDYIVRNEITPTAFARSIGCLDRCVAKWLNGTNTPSLEYVVKVADFMEVSTDYLLGLDEKTDFIPSQSSSSFADRFVLLIEKSNISKNKLSKICGVTSSTISKWILRGQIPKPDVIVKLAIHFNCSVDYLIGRSDRK